MPNPITITQKIIALLNKAGIDYSKMAGKIDPNKISPLFTKTQKTATKPKLIDALNKDKATFTDALDIFENDAKYLSQMNEMEQVNFANNLEDYFTVGGKVKYVPSNVVTQEGTPVVGKKLEKLAERKGIKGKPDETSLQGAMEGLMSLVDDLKGISPTMRRQMDRDELVEFIRKMRGKDFTNQEIKMVREYMDTYSIGLAKEKAAPAMQYAKKLKAKTKDEFELIQEYLDNVQTTSPKEFRELYGSVKKVNMQLSEIMDAKLEKHFKKKYKWDNTKTDGGLDDVTFDKYEDELYEAQKEFGDFHRVYDTDSPSGIFGTRKSTSWVNHPKNYLDDASEKLQSITGEGLNVDFYKNYTDDVLTKYPKPEKFQYGGIAGMLGETDRVPYGGGGTGKPPITFTLQGGGSYAENEIGPGLNLAESGYGFDLGAEIGLPWGFSATGGLGIGRGKTEVDFNDQNVFTGVDETKLGDKWNLGIEGKWPVDFNKMLMGKADGGIAGMLGEPTYADDNHRVPYGKGKLVFDAARRKFLQLLGAGAAGTAAAKSGIFGLLKAGKPAIVKDLTSVPIHNAEGMPAWFKPLVNRVIKEGTETTKLPPNKGGAYLERQIVHSAKLGENQGVRVYQNLDDQTIRVEYQSADNMGGVDDAVHLEYKAAEEIEPMLPQHMDPKNPKGFWKPHKDQKTKPTFEAKEAYPHQDPNDYKHITFEGDNTVNEVKDLYSDTSALKQFATGKALSKKELAIAKQKRKEVKKITDNPAEELAGNQYYPDEYASGGRVPLKKGGGKFMKYKQDYFTLDPEWDDMDSGEWLHILKLLRAGEVGAAEGGRVPFSKGKFGEWTAKGLAALMEKLFPGTTKLGKTSRPMAEKTQLKKAIADFQERQKNKIIDHSGDAPRAGEGRFTKAEAIIMRLENTIKGMPNDKYVQETFPNFIKEIKAKPELANNQNVWDNLMGELPKDQQFVIYGDDTVDFFTQSKFGPHNIASKEAFHRKHPYLTKQEAIKISTMEPTDQVMELKRLQTLRTTKHATGGRVPLALGGISDSRVGMLFGGGLYKTIIKNLAKEKGISPSSYLAVTNWKHLPEGIRKIISKSEFEKMKASRIEMFENLVDMAKSRKEFLKNIEQGKKTPAAPVFEHLEKSFKSPVPSGVTDKDILQGEFILKNLKTKDRKLNATGGLAGMLGE